MAVETTAPATRRSILAAGLGGLVALVAAALGRPTAVRALDGGPVLIGGTNEGTTQTSLENIEGSEITFKAIQGAGIALRAETSGGTAVSAAAASSGKGVVASSNTSTAINGSSDDGTASDFTAQSFRSGVIGTVGSLGTPGNVGAIAMNTDEVGVYGYSNVSDSSAGIWGDSWLGTGVAGTGATGVHGSGDYGVYGVGYFYGLYGAAMEASGGYALYTNGKIKFNGRSGRSYVPTGRSYKEVAINGMTTSSVVIATLQTNRAGFYVQSVLSYTGRFRLYLNRVAPGNTYFSYLVIG